MFAWSVLRLTLASYFTRQRCKLRQLVLPASSVERQVCQRTPLNSIYHHRFDIRFLACLGDDHEWRDCGFKSFL